MLWEAEKIKISKISKGILREKSLPKEKKLKGLLEERKFTSDIFSAPPDH